MPTPEELLAEIRKAREGTPGGPTATKRDLESYSTSELRQLWRAGRLDEAAWQAEIVARGNNEQAARDEVSRQKNVGVSTSLKTKGQLTASEQAAVDAFKANSPVKDYGYGADPRWSPGTPETPQGATGGAPAPATSTARPASGTTTKAASSGGGGSVADSDEKIVYRAGGMAYRQAKNGALSRAPEYDLEDEAPVAPARKISPLEQSAESVGRASSILSGRDPNEANVAAGAPRANQTNVSYAKNLMGEYEPAGVTLMMGGSPQHLSAGSEAFMSGKDWRQSYADALSGKQPDLGRGVASIGLQNDLLGKGIDPQTANAMRELAMQGYVGNYAPRRGALPDMSEQEIYELTHPVNDKLFAQDPNAPPLPMAEGGTVESRDAENVQPRNFVRRYTSAEQYLPGYDEGDSNYTYVPPYLRDLYDRAMRGYKDYPESRGALSPRVQLQRRALAIAQREHDLMGYGSGRVSRFNPLAEANPMGSVWGSDAMKGVYPPAPEAPSMPMSMPSSTIGVPAGGPAPQIPPAVMPSPATMSAGMFDPSTGPVTGSDTFSRNGMLGDEIPQFASGTGANSLVTDEPMTLMGDYSGMPRARVGEPTSDAGGMPAPELLTTGAAGPGSMKVTPLVGDGRPNSPMGMAGPSMPPTQLTNIDYLRALSRGLDRRIRLALPVMGG